MRLGNFQTLSLDASAWGGASGHHHRGSPPLPLPARHERGEGWGGAGERGSFHGIGAANWNPLSPLLRRGERESTSRMVVVSRCAPAWDPRGGVRLAPQLSGRLGQRGAVRLNLPNRFNDVIHVPAVGQQQILGQPDRRRADLLVAGNLFQVGAQVVRVLAPARGFLNQLVELLHEDHGLELLHPVIAATGEILLCASKAARGTSYVVKGVAPVQEFIAVAGDGAALATRDMLGILKTE